MTSSYKLPKSFKQAALDTESVDPDTLTSKKQQLWHFTFPQDVSAMRGQAATQHAFVFETRRLVLRALVARWSDARIEVD